MRVRNNKTVYLKRKDVDEDDEGGKYAVYGTAIAIDVNISPTSGRLQALVYGEKVNRMKNVLYDGTESVVEGDGMCVDVASTEEPDYRVVSSKPWSSHQQIELEKIL